MKHQQPVFKLFLITLWNKYAACIPNQKTSTMEPVPTLNRGNSNQLYRLKKVFLLAGMLFYCALTFGQSYNVLNKRIDSLVKLNLPKSALVEVDKLEQLSRKDKNTAQQLRATIYRMKFEVAIEENAMPLVITRLKQDIAEADYPVKPVLQSLLGSLYWNYYMQNRWRFAQRTRLEKVGNDIEKWDLQTIHTEMARMFKLSLQDYKKEQETPIEVLDAAITGEKNTRYLRPTLYDLLVQRAFDYFLGDEPALTKPKLPFTLTDNRLFSDSRTFADLLITSPDTVSTYYMGIKYLQQATKFHLQQPANPEALIDLDLKRLQFLQRVATAPQKDDLYLLALSKIASANSKLPISADALVLQGKYYNDKDSLVKASAYFEKALAAYPASLGGKNAEGYLKLIRHQEVTAIVEHENVSDKPMLAQLSYRNISAVKLVVYKITAVQFNQLSKIPSKNIQYMDGITIYPSDSVMNYLKKLKPVQNDKLELLGSEDHRSHNSEFKINGQPSGHYVIVLSDANSDNKELTILTTLKICSLTYVTRRNPDGQVELRVLNRETGVPVPNVNVTIAETTQLITDANGACTFASTAYNFSVKLTTKVDTFYNAYRDVMPLPRSEKNITTTLFTDRQIYRPGQTVYFKGLVLQNTEGQNSIMRNESVTLDVMDNNYKKVMSTPQVTNEFGTFAGSFTIPQNILNGYVTLNAANGSKRIRVEEYKRPTFEAEFSPVKASYKPNDSVRLSGKVTAYSGYGLSNARVAYRITRRSTPINNRYAYWWLSSRPNYNDVEITTDTIKADAQGKFEIKFKAHPDEAIALDKVNYVFNITADVTDGSAETHTANTTVVVGLNNVAIVRYGLWIRSSSKDSIIAKLNNLNDVPIKGSFQLKIYALEQPNQVFKNKLWGVADKQLMSRAEFKKHFPEYAYTDEANMDKWPVKALIADVSQTVGESGSTVFKMTDMASQPTGTYKMVLIGKATSGDTTSNTFYTFMVNKPGKLQTIDDWVTPVSVKNEPGKPATFLVGTGKASTILMEKYSGKRILSSQWLHIPQGNQQLISVPINANEKNVKVQFLMVYQNRLYSKYQPIYVPEDDDRLKLKFLTYRDKLQPGEKEQWKIQVSGKDKQTQAEMLASLYDASLDSFAPPDNWSNSQYLKGQSYINYYVWSQNPVANTNGTLPLQAPKYYQFSLAQYGYERLNLLGYSYYGGYNSAFLFAKMKGVQVGYSGETVLRETVTGSVSTVRLNGKAYAMDAVEYKASDYMIRGGAAKALPADILDKVQTIDDYGDQVNLTGIKDGSPSKIMNGVPIFKPITLRSNFNETAFFYPQLRTNEKGEILIDFTIPQSLTKWKFRAFAHTQDLNSGYIESTVVTQKQLSISANIPRFLREGDTVTISARLANLTATGLKGKVNLVLLNAINLKPVKLLLNAKDAEQSFDIAANTTKTVSFRMVIPSGIDALTYRLTADAGTFTDGEENTLPILQNRMLVTESMPMMVRSGQTKNFNFSKLINQSSTTLKSKTLTLEYTQNPAWYALQALPYMMEFPYECSEQIFSRYYANSLGTNLVNKMPVVKQVFDQWKATNSNELLSNLEKNQELKSTLLEETPWLRDATNESEQKKRIALLFDLNKMSYELQSNLNKLKDRQLTNGGFPWFGGDKADPYITRYILAGIGQLYHLGVVDTKNETLKNIADKAMDYLDNTLIADAEWEKAHNQYDGRILGSNEIHAYYTQSYFTTRQMPSAVKTLLGDYLQKAEIQWVNESLYQQGMVALTMLRFNKPDVAKKIIASLIERSQQTDELGMYWGKNQLGYFWYQSPIATQCLMIELFAEAGDAKDVEEMKIWLLRSKQTNNWKTTTATAAACYALLLKGDNWLADTGTSTIKLDGKNLNDLKPDLKAETGTGYIKTNWVDEQIKPTMGKVSITNNGKTISWGALHWQYLENLDKITASSTDIHLERQYFIQKQEPNGAVLVAVDAKHQPKTGDLLKVVVYLKAGRDFEYVQLKDMRPAGTEPVDVLSSYKYQDGLFYYQVTKDVATNFFISYLSKGTHVFEYRLRVAQPGNFSTGISTVQCMYAPEFNAHSEGSRMVIE